MTPYATDSNTPGLMDQGARYSDPCVDPVVIRLCVAVSFLLFHAVLLFHVSLIAFIIIAKDI